MKSERTRWGEWKKIMNKERMDNKIREPRNSV